MALRQNERAQGPPPIILCNVTLTDNAQEQQASPAGWCIMMRALGMAKRLPFAPAASSTVAVLAQSPSAIVHTSGLMASIVSRSAMTE